MNAFQNLHQIQLVASPASTLTININSNNPSTTTEQPIIIYIQNKIYNRHNFETTAGIPFSFSFRIIIIYIIICRFFFFFTLHHHPQPQQPQDEEQSVKSRSKICKQSV